MTPNVVTTIFAAKDMMSQKVMAMQKNVSNAGQNAFSFARKAAVAGAVILTPLALAAKQAVDFEDKMSDVAKTTGMQGAELRKFGDEILEMSMKTRSSIDDIATIAEIGGRLGIAKKDLKGFTVEANKFAVALGGDFSGGVESAITEFGKLKNLFADTRDLDVSESLKKSGSAFNILSSKGVNVEGLTDFSLRVGALPEVMRPTLASASALGATLQKSGVDAQIASSGFSNFITKAATQVPLFAKEMNKSDKYVRNLINTDSAQFFAEFAEKMQGIPADELALKLKKLGLNSLEVQKAVGAMSGSMKTYTEFSALANEQMKTGSSITDEYNTKNNNTAGQMAKLKNSLRALAITVGNALLPVVNSLVESVAPMIKSAGEWMQKNKGLVTTIVKVAAAIGVFSIAVSGVSFVFGSFQKVGSAATMVMELFGVSTTLATGPLGIMIVAVGALAASMAYMATQIDLSTASERVNNEVKQRALDKTIDQRVELAILFNTLRKTKEGTDAYKGALDKIDKMSPGLVQKYQLQEKNLRKIAAAERQLAKDIMARAMVESRQEIFKEKTKQFLQNQQKGEITGWEKFLYGTDGTFFGMDMGSGYNPEEQNKLKNELNVLSNQIARDLDQNPAPMKNGLEKGKTDKMEINITGLPDGSSATMNGKPISSGSGIAGKFKLAYNR